MEFRCELEELITEREGMIALNMQREAIGHPMAYGVDEFTGLQEKMRMLKEKISLLGER